MNIKDLNKEIKNCKTCRLAKTRTNALCGEGDFEANLMLIAQAPGENEDREGRMFIGPSGKILDELLLKAGVNRDKFYITNLIKCMLPKNRKPKQDEIDTCGIYLEKEIKIVHPGIISTFGYYATWYIFRKFNIEIPEKRKDFSDVIGRLHFAEGIKIYPLRHPAALLYDDSQRLSMQDNYKKLRIFISQCKWYPCCPMKYFYEDGKLDRKWIDRYCKGDWENCIRYWMEEKGEHHPDEMLPDGTIDKKLNKNYSKKANYIKRS